MTPADGLVSGLSAFYNNQLLVSSEAGQGGRLETT
jgi:hypothetical protein